MAQPRTDTFEVPEGLARELEAAGLTRPAGGACRYCDFTTKKKGFSATQAIRAHSKVHRNDRRAWQRPFFAQSAVVLVILGLAVTGLAGVQLPPGLLFTLPLATLPEDITRWMMWGVVVLLGVLSGYMLTVPAEVGGRRLARDLRVLGLVSSVVGAGTLANLWELVGPTLPWTVYVPVAGLALLTPVLAAKAGKVKLVVRRRQVRPDSYQALVEPKSEEARSRIARLLERPRRPKGNNSRPKHKCPGCGKRINIGSGPGIWKCNGCGTLLDVKPVPGSRRVTVERLARS